MLTLGSLFDGSGTAPLAATMCGIRPVWASEIETYPIAATKKNFPDMKHLGDITKINGAEVEPVDIICGGSPCQDLSVAGAQKGIHEGERSHLFFEMTRIIKEMRKATHGEKPRFVIWENVPGAFSSNGGRDFLAVIRAFAETADPNAYVPEPERRKGRTDQYVWKYAGSIVGNGWSIAWRTVDAQYWGVPKRRRRIYLVLDLGDERAAEVLFERKGVPGDTEPCGAAGQGTAADPSGSDGGSHTTGDRTYAVRMRSGCEGGGKGPVIQEDKSGTLVMNNDQTLFVPDGGGFYGGAGATRAGVAECKQYFTQQRIGLYIQGGAASNLMARDYKSGSDLVVEPVVYPGVSITDPVSRSNPKPGDAAPTLVNDSRNYLVDGGKPRRKYIVRRLTPVECQRLQGFPDGYEDGVPGSDSARYKMWGNGMALPNMYHLMSRLAAMDRGEEI